MIDKIKSKIVSEIIYYYEELDEMYLSLDRDFQSNSLEDNKLIDEFLDEWDWEDDRLKEFNNICEEYDLYNPLEYYQPNNNSISCKICFAGNFQVKSSATDCSICPAGFFSENDDSPSCAPCTP